MDVTDYVMRLSRATRRQKRGRGQKGPIPRSAFRVLSFLLDRGPMRVGDLAESLGIRPASLSEQLDRMEKYGLIEKKKDEADLRAIRIILTDKGRAAHGRTSLYREERRRKLEAVLTEEERRHFIEISRKLIDFYESENPVEASRSAWRQAGEEEGKP